MFLEENEGERDIPAPYFFNLKNWILKKIKKIKKKRKKM